MEYSRHPYIKYTFGLLPNVFRRYVVSRDMLYVYRALRSPIEIHLSDVSVFDPKQSIFHGCFNLGDVELSMSGETKIIERVRCLDMFIYDLSKGKKYREEADAGNVKNDLQDDYELLPELLHIPAIPIDLYRLLQQKHHNYPKPLVEWLVKEGEFVEVGQDLAKINVEHRALNRTFKLVYGKEVTIRSPYTGKIYKIMGKEATRYHLVTVRHDPREYAAKFEPTDSIMLMQAAVRKTDNTYSYPYPKLKNIYQPMRGFCFIEFPRKFDRLEDKHTMPREFDTAEMTPRVEPIVFEIDRYKIISDEGDLDSIVIKIPELSNLVYDALEVRHSSDRIFNVNVGDRVNRGQVISTIKCGRSTDEPICTRSPLSGKIVFIGLDVDRFLDVFMEKNKISSSRIGINNKPSLVWCEKKNWPIKRYYNESYNEARSLLMMIQPENGCTVTSSEIIKDTYSEVLKELDDLLSGVGRWRNKGLMGERRDIIEKEIDKLNDCKARIVEGITEKNRSIIDNGEGKK